MFRYRPSERKTPREDYFTEIFASTLEKYDALKTAFICHLISDDDIQAADIQTQKNFHGRRVDVYVEARDVKERRHVLIIENKIDAPQGPDQLATYMGLLEQEQNTDSKTLVYITKRSENPVFKNQPDSVQFKHIKWFEVYNWIKCWAETPDNGDATAGDVLAEFLTLMEDWSMGGNINAAAMRAAVRYHDSLNSGWRLVEEMIDPAWGESGIDAVIGETSGRWKYNYWSIWMSSPEIVRFRNALISMGFRFDRRDADWNVDETELPSAAITIKGENPDVFPRPSRKWQKGPVDGMDSDDLWVKQISGKPRHGESLCEFYRKFFLKAFVELREVMANE